MQIFPKNQKESEVGVTFIEVIVSLAFVGVMLIIYASALNTAALSKQLRYETFAYHVANKKMEELRSMTIATLPANGAIADPMLSSLPSGAGNFTVVDHVGFTGLKEITITVSWNQNGAKQVQLKSLAGTGGINP
ncbi:MAG TPA: hypothetical protein VD998_00545 [Verrucomicrobiae bacterium]|nr:hypothetical protein [Verrucomicrobiae bacterium]